MKKEIFIKIFVNVLTSARVLGALIIIPIYFKWGSLVAAITSGALFVTDFLDGLLARLFHVQSFFGSVLDTVSDKLLGISILIVLVLEEPLYFLPIIFEIIIFLINIISIKIGNNVKTSIKGKIKTNILDIVLVIDLYVIATNYIHLDTVLKVVIIPLIVSELLVVIDYFIKAYKNTRTQKKQKNTLTIIRKKNRKEILHDLFDTNFYLTHRNDGLKNLFYITK